MRTTIELPEDLVRQVEARATHEGRSLNDLVLDGLRRVLDTPQPNATPPRRLSFPLVPETAQGPGVSPDQVNQALTDEDTERYARFVRR